MFTVDVTDDFSEEPIVNVNRFVQYAGWSAVKDPNTMLRKTQNKINM